MNSEDELIYQMKQEDFRKFAHLIKWESAMGKHLRSARYVYEPKQRADNPELRFIDEYLLIKANGYEYKIAAGRNSELGNEMQLIAVLCFPSQIQGLLSKEGI